MTSFSRYEYTAGTEDPFTLSDATRVSLMPQLDAGVPTANSRTDGVWQEIKTPNQKSKYFTQCSGPINARIPGTVRVSLGSGHAIGRRLVLTAAHVVHPGSSGNAYESPRFIPGWPWNNDRYQTEKLYVPSQYVSSNDRKFDFALMLLDRDLKVDGYSGVIADVPHTRGDTLHRYFTNAYPAEPPFNTQQDKQAQDSGPYSDWAFTDEDTGLYFNDGYAAWENFDLTPGSSGGAWLLLNRAESVPHTRILNGKYWGNNPGTNSAPYDVNGVNSYTKSDKDGAIFSPYFSSATIGVFLSEALQDIAQG